MGKSAENGDVGLEILTRIINVADPINAHDAVNLNYLTTNYYTKAVTDAALATTLTSANTYTDSVATTTLSQANAYTDAAVGSVVNTANQYTDQQIAKVSKEAAQGTALATPLDFSNGSNAMAIGTGFYKGQSALSVVGGKRLDNLTYTAGVAKTGGEHAVKLSLGFSW